MQKDRVEGSKPLFVFIDNGLFRITVAVPDIGNLEAAILSKSKFRK